MPRMRSECLLENLMGERDLMVERDLEKEAKNGRTSIFLDC